uniref:Uncharacterized protein n=1 Tax=Hyaloperonospora arabidopsidis (strain Emoy2) TaxID=559515 RepID=M4B572_HYAAE
MTMHTAYPVTPSEAYRSIDAPKLKDFKIIEFTGKEKHSGLGADWNRTNLTRRDIRLRHSTSWSVTKGTD